MMVPNNKNTNVPSGEAACHTVILYGTIYGYKLIIKPIYPHKKAMMVHQYGKISSLRYRL